MMFDMSISPDGTPSPDGIPTLERARHVVDKYHEAAAGGLAEALNFTGVDAELLAPTTSSSIQAAINTLSAASRPKSSR